MKMRIRPMLLAGVFLTQPSMAAEFSSYRVPGDANATHTVPSSAVIRRNGIPGVFIWQNNLARFVMVKPGKRRQRNTEILSGLLPGDQVILGPVKRLHDGSPVTLNQ